MAEGGDLLSANVQPALDLSGATLEGAYRLVRLIGQGGMGAVYEAVQLRLNKRVAIKIMSREQTTNMVTLARFHREAEITSQLGHPHLINVMDFGTSESGEPYLVMEMLDGEDLDTRLQKVGRLPLETMVRITRQSASALGAAHAQDVVHRDMKPANIFLLQVPGETEFVKVLDFGISKMKAARAKLTRASAVVGTPIYMSPEQTRGDADNTDHRADQWALACIAWEMLSGYPPFLSDDVNALFLQINRVDPPPLARHVSDLVPGVESVLRKALSKRVVDRYPSIREFAHALEDAAFDRPVELTLPPEILSTPTSAEASSGKAVADPASTGGDIPGEDAGQGTGQRHEAGSDVALHSPPVSLESFIVTAEVGAGADPLWRKPIVAMTGAAGLVLLAVFLLHSSKTPLAAHGPAAHLPRTTAQTEVATFVPPTAPNKVATPMAVPTIPVATAPKHPAPSARQAKPVRDPGAAATASSIPKLPAPKTPPKPKIFLEL
jgi:serine/threonine protein kinase